MGWFNRTGRVVAAFLLAQGLVACAVIDNYSGRAVDYNREAEQAQEQVLLLNIVRASLRRPMQFTSLQSITGSANVSASVAGGTTDVRQTPYLSQFPNLVQSTNIGTALSRIATATASGNASMGGSATFTVPVLDTQEFYQGLLAPVPLQVIDYYLQQGFPPQLLAALFVLKVEITRLDDGSCRRFTFVNSVRDDLQFGQFDIFSDYLIGSGLTAERINSSTPYGPPIPHPGGGPASAEETAKVVEAYSKASSAGLDIRQERRGNNVAYRLQKKSSTLRLCFAHPGGPAADWLARPNSPMFCGQFNQGRSQARPEGAPAESANECVPRGARAGRPLPSGNDDDDDPRGVHANGISEFRGIRLSPEFLQRIDRLQRAALAQRPDLPDEALFPVRAFAGGLVSFRFYTRSTEGILYYLGEITRRRLFTEFGDRSRTIQIKTGLRYGTLPATDCDDLQNNATWEAKSDLIYLSRRRAGARPRGRYYCENLFVLDNADTLSADNVITVSYDGMRLGIPRDPNRRGRTTQVLELVKQLLALNTSAKTLPATGVISVVSP